MINIKNSTPSVYYNQSRDFQFIGRLYEIVTNYLKTNIDLIYSLPSKNTDFVDLLALTLGLNLKHDYNTNQLMAICSIFPTILRNKGTFTALKLVGDTILHAEGITDTFDYLFDNDTYTLTVFIPIELTDLNLFNDLLEYILPAGVCYNIVKTTRVKTIVSENYSLNEQVTISKVNLERTAKLRREYSTMAKDWAAKDQPGYSINATILRPNENMAKVTQEENSEEIYSDGTGIYEETENGD